MPIPITKHQVTRRTATALAVGSLAAAATALRPSGAVAATKSPSSPLQRDADALRDSGVTGLSVRLESPRGVRAVRSGVGDLRTGRPVPLGGYVRIGSTTKSFVATVLLQLVGEGRLSLEDTLETWLPGVVRGSGNDGRRITVRQMLQHTSGLPDYIGDVVPDLTAAGYRRHRWTTYTSAERVAFAMKHPPSFEPGARREYANTNYILAGMLIRAVTGRSWEREVRARILDPLRLVHTLAPGNQPHLPSPHARNYQQFEVDGPWTDTTLAYLPFDGDADGSLISTTADTNTFFKALLRGDLLAPAQLAEMQRPAEVPPGEGDPEGTRYGLGLEWTPLSCGGGYWGHSGTGFGSMVWPAATPDGRYAVMVSVHSNSADEETVLRQVRGVTGLVDRALCAARAGRAG